MSPELFENAHTSAYDNSNIQFLVCKVCNEQGYRRDNIDEIPCRHGHSRGRDAFDKQDVGNWKRRGTIPECILCKSQQLCEACNVRKDPDKFDRRVLRNARKSSRKLVCLECQTLGYSPRDCQSYFCNGSETTGSHEVGHLKFTHVDLKRAKKNVASKIPLCCVDCKLEPANQRGHKRPLAEGEEHGNYNVRALLQTLRQKGSWRCTCKSAQPAPKMKAKSALAGKYHDAKCMLQCTVYGEKRWDGKNMGITLEQLRYLADRNLY